MLSSSACDDAAAAPVGDDKPAGGSRQQPAAALEVGEAKVDENSPGNGPPVEAGKAEGDGQQQPQPQQVTVVPTVPTTMHQMELFVRIRELVKKAVAAKHTFMIYGRSRVVREALLSRGWCEKYQKKAGEQQLSVDSSPSSLLAGIGSLHDKQNERLLISKMLGNHTVDFLWNAGSEWSGWPSQDNKTTIFNRFTRANFTSKVGLCSNVRQMHWYYEAGIANTLFPRCYNISQPDQLHAFIEDFRLTACLSLLKWLVDKVKAGGEESVRAQSGVIPLRALDFAIGRCSDFIGSKSHEDIDQELEKVWSHQWEQFIGWYYKLVHGQALFIASNVPMNKYLLASRHLLRKIDKFWPQLEMDGTLNIWILKPGNKSRGRGIVLMNKLDDILAKVSPSNKTTDTRFVIQKYIERPLLIYETKFDIRQWFIVTNAQPLTLWMYRESYLRFCSQRFSLTDFHESIHLSNNAVQCKYKNSPERDAALPQENMWDVATFKEFLKDRGNGEAWDELIYPGMKQGLVGSLLASQEAMDRRKNSFELYGADFMLMEDFSVWLIEINSHPDMSNSTSVTTRLCRKAMEDTIKVVVDYRENPNADTGDFELVYKQKLSSCQAYLGTGLSLHGTRIALGEKRSSTGTNVASSGGSSSGSSSITAPLAKRKAAAAAAAAAAAGATDPPPTRVGPVLVDLIEELELQLDHEFYEYLRLRSASGLSRRVLPLMPLDLDLPKQNNDSETNTLAKGIQLFVTSSQQNLRGNAASASSSYWTAPGRPAKSGAKGTSSKKSARNRTGTSQVRNADSTSSAQAAKTFMSKVLDLEKESSKSKSAVPSGSSAKLYRASRVPDTLTVPSTDGPDPADTTSPKPSRRAVLTPKTIPPIPGATLMPPLTKTGAKSAAPDKKRADSRRRSSRAATSSVQVFVDVKDMYAVGLAVNK